MEWMRISGCILMILTSGYIFMIFWFALPLLLKKKKDKGSYSVPLVTVIIAARNEQENIAGCIATLTQQDYPSDRFEVIVSDDHSTDQTKEIVIQLRDTGKPLMLSLVEAGAADKTGKKPAIERAISLSRGDVILTTDADTARGREWISAMVNEYLANGPKMVLGPVGLTGDRIFQRMQRLEFLGIMGFTAGSVMAGIPLMCNGANLLYEKKGFAEAGGYSGNLKYPSGDDQFLLSRFRKIYGRNAAIFALRREAIVTTPAEATLRGFLNQRMRWVSKSKGYRDAAVLLSGIFTWLLQAALLSAMVAGIWFPWLLQVAAGCFCMKIAADLLLVVPMGVLFGVMKDMWLYVPAQLFQLVYVPLTGVAGLVLPYRWKGRLIKA